jgi:transposase
LAARGIKTDRRAVWFFLHAEGLSFKKNRTAGRAVPSRHRVQARTLEGPPGQG